MDSLKLLFIYKICLVAFFLRDHASCWPIEEWAECHCMWVHISQVESRNLPEETRGRWEHLEIRLRLETQSGEMWFLLHFLFEKSLDLDVV